MKASTTALRRPHLVLAAAVLALVYSAVTGVAQPQPAAAAAKFAQPIAGSVWQAGTRQTILWSDGTPGSQPLRLMKGSATALQQVMEIAVVDGTSNQYNWVVPSDLPTDDTYAIALGNSPDIGYTGQFTITQGVPSPFVERPQPSAPASGPTKP
ncbi:GPI anchored serine-threonine rich family protein [Streptomyces sp. NPDC058369]|uniref:GPI anchored serine-threonine rich family protein n=1 Tax=Streptomyces sp. NPDC058369 TaxID=3346462 RepID=UPI00365D51D0